MKTNEQNAVTLYAPIHEYGAYRIEEITVKKWHAAGNVVFLNGQHYNALFRTAQEAYNFTIREGAYCCLTLHELLDLLNA